MTDVRLRPIDSRDIGELIALGEAANLSSWTSQNYLDELQNPHAQMLSLRGENDRLIGFIVGRVVPASDSPDAIDADIYNIAVDERHRRQRYAQTLLNEFVDRVSGLHVRRIWLEVRESNTPATTFYKKNGFGVVSTRRDFYRNPIEDGLLMRLDLISK